MTQPRFLQTYAQMMSSYETPEIYDLWAAMATLASVVSRRCWFDLGNIRIFPNLYIVLVGPPGARKNTAMMYSQELLESIGNIPMVQGATTKEKLVAFMSEECKQLYHDPERNIDTEFTPLTIFANELTHFLGTKAEAAIHMVDFLTLMYDKVGDYNAGTISRGDNIVLKPCLNLFAATTPSNIARYLKEEALSGGMARRTIFVNANRSKTAIPIPEVSNETLLAKTACLEFLAQLTTISGPFTWAEGAKEWYIPWYEDLFKQVQNEKNDLIGGYLSSKHVQLFKVAMLHSLNRGYDRLISVEDMQVADALLTKIEAELPVVYEGLGANEQASVARRIEDTVRNAGGRLPDRILRQTFFKDTKELAAIMQHLQDAGKLVCLARKNADGSTGFREWFLPEHPLIASEKVKLAPGISPTPGSAEGGSPPPPPAVPGGQ